MQVEKTKYCNSIEYIRCGNCKKAYPKGAILSTFNMRFKNQE